MGFGVDDVARMWSDLMRRESELARDRLYRGSGHPHDSLGRLAGSFHDGWAHEQLGRVERVRRALEESGPRARQILVRRLAGIDLSAVWPILMSACQDIALLYGGSVVAGGVIGGIGGAMAGGVGALPGAAAGAAAGGHAGGWVLGLLGLKSLAEGVAQALPEALQYYERGFREAWGPALLEHVHAGHCSTACSPQFAADDLAHGHVIVISALLAALAAYLTRAKGDKAALMKELGASPRLGPKLAQWVEQNDDRLRRLPPLESRGSGGSGVGLPPHQQPPQLKRRDGERKERERPGPAGMSIVKVPCFKTQGLPQGSVPEFDRQLTGQEAGINSMTVEEYLEGREAFDSKRAVRDRGLARNARAAYQVDLIKELNDEYRGKGFSVAEAKRMAVEEASSKMKTLAALHAPDMVAGGKDAIGDFGDRRINSRIGAQWKNGGRLNSLDDAAKTIPQALRRTTKMNANLQRCK